MFPRSLVAVAILAVQCGAVPLTHTLHERSLHDPVTLVKSELAARDAVVPVRIGLTQQNLDYGDELLHEIANSRSEHYGQHLTAEEVRDLFAPNSDSINAVKSWLESERIDPERVSLSANKQWIQFDCTPHEIESLLKTTYHIYEHTDSGDHFLGTDEYHVPHHLASHVDYVTPGVKMGKVRVEDYTKRNTNQARGLAHPVAQKLPNDVDVKKLPCSDWLTPKCIRELYVIPKGTTAVAGNGLGLYESLLSGYGQPALDYFFERLLPEVPVGTKPIAKSVDGGVAEYKTPHPVLEFESNLDLEVAWPVIYPHRPTIYQVNDPPNELHFKLGLVNNFFDAIDGSYCQFSAFGETGDNPKYDATYPDKRPGGWNHPEQCGVYKPTPVISVSYGIGESQLPVNYQRRRCKEIMKLALQGTTFVVASGDSGVDGAITCGSGNTVFGPESLNSCPYTLSVGAIELIPGRPPKPGNERVVNTTFSSGSGFSNIFPIPAYQNASVHHYLKNTKLSFKSYVAKFGKGIPKNDSSGRLFNRAGRAFPDVTALGLNISTYNSKGHRVLGGGTSASAPLFGSILTRINEERLKAGKSTVGFVQPIFYEHPELFTDITIGRSPGCKTNGFPATEGWDPASGLGTPLYPKMLEHFMSLP